MTITCGNCAAPNPQAARFCESCGASLSSQPRRGLAIGLGVAGALVLLTAGGIGFAFAINGLQHQSSGLAEPVIVSPDFDEPTATSSAPPTGEAIPILPPPPGPQPPSGSFGAVDAAALALPGWDGVHFISPSGNLGCAITDEGALWGCAIVEKRWAFESDTPDDYCYDSQVPCGQGIEASHDGLPHPRERGDPGFPAAIAISNGGTDGENVLAVLQYGQSVTYGDVTCYSESIAVTCHNHFSGHGFVIARDRNDIY